MSKNKMLEKLDKEIMELENLVSKTMVENEIIKLNIKKKELLLNISSNSLFILTPLLS